ncbi:MAG TPA: D-tyrosyl-tRNA(Tyr) deacylase [Gammaproteobacteria bacterium]|nr:D-tyrosyl-tRNA(Tyr) deacylase [Gammaproteobacteria bacterium]
MRALVQRVKQAEVRVAGTTVGKIANGLLVFVAIEPNDKVENIECMARKLLSYRIFNDADGKMNLSLTDVRGGILVVSQFTLAADTSKGLRPSFTGAADKSQAKYLYELLLERLGQLHHCVASGQFGADMEVSLINDGPVTFLLSER